MVGAWRKGCKNIHLSLSMQQVCKSLLSVAPTNARNKSRALRQSVGHSWLAYFSHCRRHPQIRGDYLQTGVQRSFNTFTPEKTRMTITLFNDWWPFSFFGGFDIQLDFELSGIYLLKYLTERPRHSFPSIVVPPHQVGAKQTARFVRFFCNATGLRLPTLFSDTKSPTSGLTSWLFRIVVWKGGPGISCRANYGNIQEHNQPAQPKTISICIFLLGQQFLFWLFRDVSKGATRRRLHQTARSQPEFLVIEGDRESAWSVGRQIKGCIWATDKITCLGKMPSINVGGLLWVIRVLDVQGINIKTEACDLQRGMIWFATWPRIAGEQAKMREFL